MISRASSRACSPSNPSQASRARLTVRTLGSVPIAISPCGVVSAAESLWNSSLTSQREIILFECVYGHPCLPEALLNGAGIGCQSFDPDLQRFINMIDIHLLPRGWT